MIFEGLNCGYRTMTREFIRRMARSELEEWLEFRGFAVYDDESTSLLRDCALEDYDNEHGCENGNEEYEVTYSADPV